MRMVELSSAQRIKSFLLKEFGTKVAWSSTDTPKLNAVSERKFWTLRETTLAMLDESGFPKNLVGCLYYCL